MSSTNTYTRQEALESLYRITFTQDEGTPSFTKAKEYIKLTLGKEEVPQEVVKFLDNETSSGYTQCFLNRMKNKKFMRTLKSLDTNQVSNEVFVKAINSIVTHAIIDIELGNASRQIVLTHLKIEKLTNIVKYYFNTGSLPEDAYETVRNLLDS